MGRAALPLAAPWLAGTLMTETIATAAWPASRSRSLGLGAGLGGSLDGGGLAGGLEGGSAAGAPLPSPTSTVSLDGLRAFSSCGGYPPCASPRRPADDGLRDRSCGVRVRVGVRV